MLIVSDTTPLHYLILIGSEHILPDLFETVIVPAAVVSEMLHPNAPPKIQQWVKNMPVWVISRISSNANKEISTGLGAGETEAISIALELNADALLLDDRRGIREATLRGISVITTIGVLELASSKGLVDFSAAINKLKNTSFYMPPSDVLSEILDRNRLYNQPFMN